MKLRATRAASRWYEPIDYELNEVADDEERKMYSPCYVSDDAEAVGWSIGFGLLSTANPIVSRFSPEY